jgi:plastocyanin
MRFRLHITLILLTCTAAAPAPPASRPQPGVPQKDAPANDANKSVRISIKGMRFDPSTLTIKPGQTVTWTNSDDRDHTVNAIDGSFKSGNLAAGASYQYTFKKKGKFPYACSYHPRMKAVIVVAE